jgi:hypothetical protein
MVDGFNHHMVRYLCTLHHIHHLCQLRFQILLVSCSSDPIYFICPSSYPLPMELLEISQAVSGMNKPVVCVYLVNMPPSPHYPQGGGGGGFLGNFLQAVFKIKERYRREL